MGEPSRDKGTFQCVCGEVEFETNGAPILSATCCCDDCQKGAAQIEALPKAPPVLDQADGTAFVLFRKDRVTCSKGADRLRDYKLTEKSPTRRAVASCCNSFMFLDFTKGHWLSMCRARFAGQPPPVQMRLQTRYQPQGSLARTDEPRYSTFPLKFVAKLVAARIAMLFG